MIKDQNRKNEEKIKELQNFIQRFAANKSKSRQATSRRKLIDKLTVEEMPASSRRYPWVAFQQDRGFAVRKPLAGFRFLENGVNQRLVVLVFPRIREGVEDLLIVDEFGCFR